MWILWTALAAAQVLPTLEGETLAGTPLSLPADLTAETTVILVAFAREHQADLDTWASVMVELGEDPDVDWLEIPVLPTGIPGLVRGLILRGMRRSKDEAARAHSLPVFTDVAAFQAATATADPSEIGVWGVGPEGQIRFRLAGPRTAETEATLRQRVE